MTERLDATVEPARRARRLGAAAGGTVAAAGGGFLVITVGRGQLLEDACLTEPPPGWAPELTVVRGPVPEGLATFRCEQASSPGDAFLFTDARPLVLSVVVVAAAVVLVGLLWAWAVRRPAATDAQPSLRSADLSAG